MTAENIQILTLGGTIDKLYFDAASAYQIGEPQIGEVLRRAGVRAPVDIRSLMRKDSLEMTDADREALHQAVLDSRASRILITHGTDTMALSGQRLADCAAKTIVLTGAMQPARFHETDAVFNIGFAFAAVQALPPGVYLAMNGQLFDPFHVAKNRAAHRFEATP